MVFAAHSIPASSAFPSPVDGLVMVCVVCPDRDTLMIMETAEQLLPTALAIARLNHDDYVARNVFLQFPPGDRGCRS
jgi:hypothetical protein